MAGLTAAQKQQFEEDGCLTVEGVLTREEVETLRRACSEVEETAQGLNARTPAIHPRILPSGRRVVDIVKGAVFQHPQFLAACTHPGVLDIIESLVGPDIQHHHSKLNWKPPLPPEQAAQGWKIGWHQDYAFFRTPTTTCRRVPSISMTLPWRTAACRSFPVAIGKDHAII